MGFLNRLRESVVSVLDPEREDRLSEQARALQSNILKKRDAFNLDRELDELDVLKRDEKSVIRLAYKGILRKVWKDAQLSEREDAALRYVAKAFRIPKAEAEDLKVKHGLVLIEQALGKVFADGHLNEAEVQELEKIARSIGTDLKGIIHRYYTREGERFLTALFASAVEDGTLEEQEWHQIICAMEQLGLRKEDVLDSLRDRAEAFVEHVLADAKADGKLSNREESVLAWLLNTLRLPDDFAQYVRKEMVQLRLLTDIGEGQLPIVTGVPMLLNSGEIANYYGRVIYKFEKHLKSGTKEVVQHGEGTVTDSRFIFSSPGATFNVTHANVIEMSRWGGWLNVRCTAKGTGMYFFHDNNDVAIAIYYTAVRKSKQTLVEKRDELPNRNISRDIRQRIWQRYGGRCAECGAKDYLEFDHIIPVARGGGNTDNNVQLLCRRCNLRKSDAI